MSVITVPKLHGDRMIGVLYYGMAMVQYVFFPGRTLVLSVLGDFDRANLSHEQPKYNEQAVR